MLLRIVKNTCAKTLISLALALAVFITAVGPVPTKAAENNTVELMQYTTVDNSGTNMFNFTNSKTVEIDVPMYTLLRYIDIIFTASDNTAPTSVRVRFNNSYTNLNVWQITPGVYRACGTLNAYYDSLFIQFNADGTQAYTIQSCKVSSVTTSSSAAYAMVELSFHDSSFTAQVPHEVMVVPPETSIAPVGYSYQSVITVIDAFEYDVLYVYGSVNFASLNSIRCSYGNTIVPSTINFIDVESDASFTPNNSAYTTNSFGKYIYAIEIDLSGIDRSSKQYCLIYMGGDYASNTGLTYNVQAVTGGVFFADTSEVTWWSKFTDFMSNLFGGDSSAADDFQTDMEQQGQEVEDAADQVEQVTKPPVEDVEVSIDSYVDPAGFNLISTAFTEFFGNNLLLGMVMISFIVGLVGFIIF